MNDFHSVLSCLGFKEFLSFTNLSHTSSLGSFQHVCLPIIFPALKKYVSWTYMYPTRPQAFVPFFLIST